MNYSPNLKRTINSNMITHHIDAPLLPHCLKKKKIIRASSNYSKNRNSLQDHFLETVLTRTKGGGKNRSKEKKLNNALNLLSQRQLISYNSRSKYP